MIEYIQDSRTRITISLMPVVATPIFARSVTNLFQPDGRYVMTTPLPDSIADSNASAASSGGKWELT